MYNVYVYVWLPHNSDWLTCAKALGNYTVCHCWVRGCQNQLCTVQLTGKETYISM